MLTRALCLIGLAVSTIARPVGAQSATSDSTGTLIGIISTKEGDVPLAYSVVSVATLGRERFTNMEGKVTLTDLPAGPLQLRVRHLGYLPADLNVVIQAGRTDTIRVALTHITVQLTAMQVHGYEECKEPGPPTVATDSTFATVFDQLRQNADQYRLLSEAYPFFYAVERTFFRVLANGDSRTESVDTLIIGSARWIYKPGTVVTRRGGGRGAVMMNIPTLVNFADDVFLENHCFQNGGVEAVDGVDLLRVDFTVASRIKEPDVNGSMYLDPVTFQIRRSVLRLSKIPSGLTGLAETEAVTKFGEVLPSVPVISDIASVNRFERNPNRPLNDASANERQRLIRVQFVNGVPGEEAKRHEGEEAKRHDGEESKRREGDARPSRRTAPVPE